MVYMEVVLEPNIVGEHIKAILADSQWPEHIEEPYSCQLRVNSSECIWRESVDNDVTKNSEVS